jgi:hypothetical protein
MKESLGHILVDNHRRKREISVEPMLEPSKALHDPITNALDGLCFQSQFSCIHNAIKSYYDMDMIKQCAPLFGLVEVSTQNSSDKIQACSELLEDMESTSAVPGYEVELVESKYPEIGHVYLDPMTIYMEKFFITKSQYISFVFQVHLAPCKEDHAGNIYQIPLTGLFMSWCKEMKEQIY